MGRLYQRFLKIRGRPKEIALGFALGLFIGFTPTMGIQIVVAVFIASLLKWSKITAALGVQITNPLTAPFIYGSTYYIGAAITGIQTDLKISDLLTLDGAMTMLKSAPGIFAALFAGGAVIGLPLAVAGYLAVKWLMDRYQEPVKAGLQSRARQVRKKIRSRQKSGKGT